MACNLEDEDEDVTQSPYSRLLLSVLSYRDVHYAFIYVYIIYHKC